jgi:hypothetical protein
MKDGRTSDTLRQNMDLARHGKLHSLHHEGLRLLGEKRATLGRKDLSLHDPHRQKAALSGVTARVLLTEKVSCPTHPVVMNPQRREGTTSQIATSQVLLLIYLLENLRLLLDILHKILRKVLSQIL